MREYKRRMSPLILKLKNSFFEENILRNIKSLPAKCQRDSNLLAPLIG